MQSKKDLKTNRFFQDLKIEEDINRALMRLSSANLFQKRRTLEKEIKNYNSRNSNLCIMNVQSHFFIFRRGKSNKK
jgi:hypothetical protein